MATAELLETVHCMEMRTAIVNDTMVDAYAIIKKVSNTMLMP